MAFHLKAYVAFDADSDIRYYRLMQAWHQSDRHSFNFEDAHDINNLRQWSSEDTIKGKLKERLKQSEVFIILIGETTKYLYKYVRWEIEQAINLDLPIVCVNINGLRSLDENRCPAILRNHLALHISYNAKILEKALVDWKTLYFYNKSLGKKGDFSYSNDVYQSLGLV